MLFYCTVPMADGDTTTVHLANIRVAVTVALKEIPGFEALIVEAAKRATEQNNGHKDDNKGHNRKEDNNCTNSGE